MYYFLYYYYVMNRNMSDERVLEFGFGVFYVLVLILFIKMNMNIDNEMYWIYDLNFYPEEVCVLLLMCFFVLYYFLVFIRSLISFGCECNNNMKTLVYEINLYMKKISNEISTSTENINGAYVVKLYSLFEKYKEILTNILINK